MDKIHCNNCVYWYDNINVTSKFGECRKNTPLLDPRGNATWPLSHETDFCYSGKKIDKTLNETLD